MRAPVGMMTMARMGKWKSVRSRKSGGNPVAVVLGISLFFVLFKYFLALGVVALVMFMLSKVRM